MQREIKFRGKTLMGVWVYGNLIQDNHSEINKSFIQYNDENDLFKRFSIEVIPETIGQFIGIRNQKGQDIYENDIIKYKSQHPKHEGKHFNNVVEFASGQSLMGWRMRNKSTIVKGTPYKFIISEVIGNIYDNPELLK